MYNLAILEGRLTRDPEVRNVGENALASFTVAVDRDTKDKDGNRQTDFINCTAWGKKAEFIAKYFHKGDGIHLDGRIQVRKYQDKDGNNRTATDINVGNVSFPPTRNTNGSGNNGGGYQTANGYNNGGFNQGNNSYGNGGGYNGFNQANNGGFNNGGFTDIPATDSGDLPF